MKSNEIKTRCPVCKFEVTRDGLGQHIARMANLEKESNLQVVKEHVNYKNQHGKK